MPITIQSRPYVNNVLRERVIACDCTYVSIEHAPDGRVRFHAEDTNDHEDKKYELGHKRHEYVDFRTLRVFNEARIHQGKPDALPLGPINHLVLGMDCIYAHG